jgi:2-(1,2-epoxy-1,2-dihydrophenyl)acetyl-CoA isomerase
MGNALFTTAENGIARIIINRPESRNALTGEVLQEMLAFVLTIEHDRDIRVLLISGAGEHFAAGGDVKSFASVLEMDPESLRRDFERRSADAAPLWLALSRMPQPVVCAVRGFAAGVALSFIAGADYTLASDTAKFLLAHVGIGLVADGATTYHLPRVIGIRKAKELAFFGDKIDAAQALEIGLINRIVPDAELEAETEILLQRFRQAPAASIAGAKRLLNASLGNDMAAQLAMETQAVGDCGASPDIKEGVRAFTEKRRPVFGANKVES